MRARGLLESTRFALVLAALPVWGVQAPKLPFYDWKACPFEGCAYRGWTATKQVAVYDTWKPNRHRIAWISAHQHVTGLRGVVITFRPGVIRVDRDVPEQALKRGDTLLTYAYRGEGFSAVWVKGRYFSEYDISIAKWPNGQGCGNEHCAATYLNLGKKEWWAAVRLNSGMVGWVYMDTAAFDGVDMLG